VTILVRVLISHLSHWMEFIFKVHFSVCGVPPENGIEQKAIRKLTASSAGTNILGVYPYLDRRCHAGCVHRSAVPSAEQDR
jgi:hypothetical protein